MKCSFRIIKLLFISSASLPRVTPVISVLGLSLLNIIKGILRIRATRGSDGTGRYTGLYTGRYTGRYITPSLLIGRFPTGMGRYRPMNVLHVVTNFMVRVDFKLSATL